MPLFAIALPLSVHRHMDIFGIADPCNVNYVDFHLDYNDPSSVPLIYEVIAQL